MASYLGVNREVARRGRLIAQTFERITGRPLTLTSGYRSPQKQAQLYEDYRAGRSAIPANPPGDSAHEVGLALDFSPGRPYPQDKRLWELYWQVARAFGFEPLGPRDPVHIQVPRWRELVQSWRRQGK